jgi:hypothetical protein
MYELVIDKLLNLKVKVGWDKLVGEIIKLVNIYLFINFQDGDTASIQCYEDTCIFCFIYLKSWINCWRPSAKNQITIIS